MKNILINISPDKNTKILFYAFNTSNPIVDNGINLQYDYEIVSSKHLKTSLESPKDFLSVFRLVFHTFKLLKKYKPLTFVQFDFMLGAPRWHGSKTKCIVIAYDVIPLILRKQYMPRALPTLIHTPGKRSRLRAFLRAAYYEWRYWMHYKIYKRADKVIAISDDTSKCMNKYLGIDSSKIFTIHLAPDINPDIKASNNIISKISIPYILYIGGTDKRKHLEELISAYNIVRSRGLRIALILAGNEFTSVHKIPDIQTRLAVINSAYKDDIHLVGFVDDGEKKALFQSAFAFVFTSHYEGFGLPLIEAMSLGCPVVSYSNSSIPESAGKAALLVNTGDYTEIANKVISLNDRKTRNKVVSAGHKQAKKFTWSDTSLRTWKELN